MDNNTDILKFINPSDNDKLSNMNEKDLYELILLLDEYYLELRDNIGLGECVTFGTEIEVEDTNINFVKELVSRLSLNIAEWEVKPDESLTSGAEITSPILNDTKDSWTDLLKITDLLNPISRIGNNSGGHIHIGSQVLGTKSISMQHFLKIWAVYENIIFRYTFGEYLSGRPKIAETASPISSQILNYMYIYRDLDVEEVNKKIISSLRETKCNAVNLRRFYTFNIDGKFIEGNTIEFRCPNGSLDPVIWQNNINLFARILLYSKRENFDEDIILKRKGIILSQNIGKQDYYKIYLEQALELVDLIFPTNIEKLYFLKQYLKSYQVSDEYKKGRVMTKKASI